jgi:cathepsin B
VLSPQDFVSCDKADHACKGGTLPGVWNYIDSHGAVSDECMPYNSGDGSNHTCPLPGCSGDGGDSKVYKCPKEHSMMNSDQEIQAAVMTVGAVEVGFTVMEDFMNYKSGIYKYKEGMALGGHAVKIVGWGKQLEQFYWIVQNSWGATWGENGYFRIVNWHDDETSAIGIGGGFACVQGATPAPPTPAPKPDTCKDIVDYCSKYGRAKCATMSYLIPLCQKTCGCCDDVLRPSYCNKTEPASVVV